MMKPTQENIEKVTNAVLESMDFEDLHAYVYYDLHDLMSSSADVFYANLESLGWDVCPPE